jgi:putative aldouronate transport system substrate-binding protein
VYGSIQPEMKQVLQTFADWYKKGYLKQDWMSSNSTSNRTDVVAGKFGVQLNGAWLGQTADMIKNYGPNAYFDAFELPSATGKPVMYPRLFDNGGYIVINKNCKDIAAVLKCVSYYGGGVYGNEFASAGFGTIEEIWDAHGYSNAQHIMPMIKVNDLLGERQIYDQLQEMKRTGNPQVLKHPSAQNSYNNGIVPFLAGDLSGFGPDRWAQMWADNCAYNVSKNIVDENRFIASRMQGPAPEEVAAYGSTLDDILAEGFTQIIVGQQPVSYFDTLVGRWKSAGGDNCTQVIHRVYGSK